MTDNEIIKALKCHMIIGGACKVCPFDDIIGDFSCSGRDFICSERMAESALELINRQKVKIEVLAEAKEQLESDIINERMNLEHLQKEVERLQETPKCVYAYNGETVEYCVEGPCSVEKTIESARAEAVKEFAERLKSRLITVTYMNFDDTIDNLVKEMVGEG